MVILPSVKHLADSFRMLSQKFLYTANTLVELDQMGMTKNICTIGTIHVVTVLLLPQVSCSLASMERQLVCWTPSTPALSMTSTMTT